MFKKLCYVSFCLLLSIVIIGSDCNKKSPTEEDGFATVTGTLTLPAEANGRGWVVIFDTDLDPEENNFVSSDTGTCGSGTSVNYSIADVPEGTYYLYAAVFVVSDGSQGPQSGDYVGVFGGTLFNPPTLPNAVVPSSGTVSFDITLSVMP